LKRADNRSLVLARAGRTVWKSDPKRADELFRSSVGELSAAISEAEMDSRNGKARQMLIVQGVRPQVLETIAVRSADLALQSFYKTRPQIVDAARL
jgi:hypothetical protein